MTGHSRGRTPHRFLSLTTAATLALAAFTAAPAQASTTDPALAPTPYMGWNTYYGLGDDFTETEVIAVAQSIKDRGLLAAGYDIIWLDGGWAETDRDTDGNLVPKREQFPSGLGHLTAQLHAMGLRAGIYTDAGELRPDTTACTMGSGGGHQQRDADQFAAWGFDAVKVDFLCGYDNGEDPRSAFGAMAQAIRNNSADRKMIFNLCNPISPEWGTFPESMMSTWSWTYAPEIAESWRTYTDVGFNGRIEFVNVLRNYDANARHPEVAGPGHWNDPDYLGPELGMTDTEFRTQMSLWAMAAAPLIVGSDVRALSQTSIDTLRDPDMVAISQDPLGHQARRISSAGDQEVWVKSMADGSRAVALLNRSASPAQVSTTLSEIGVNASSADVLDAWTDTTTSSSGQIRETVAGHGTTLLRVTAPATGANPPRVIVGQASVTAVNGQSLTSPTTDVLAPAGSTLTVRVPVHNDGTVTASGLVLDVKVPEGWRVVGSTAVPTIAPGATASALLTVTVPETSVDGARTITIVPQRGGQAEGGQAVVSVVVAPAAPQRTTSLAGHPWVSGTSGWLTPSINQSVGNGGPLRIAGRTYQSGVGVASPSELRYYLGGQCTRLDGGAGVDDLVKDINPEGGTVDFQVIGDGRTLFDSGVVTRDRYIPLDIDVTGVQDLRLRVGIGGDHTYNDRADWVEPRITCQAPVEPSPSPTASPSPTPSPSPSSPAYVPRAPYEVPGFHRINGRWWYTTCEPYSRTIRCRTDIWSKQVVHEKGAFVIKQGWFFNNLTYLPHLRRPQWGTNPLANPGEWISQARRYQTQCDTPTTGTNACRSYIWATRVEAIPTTPGHYSYRLVKGWVLNNIVRFAP